MYGKCSAAPAGTLDSPAGFNDAVGGLVWFISLGNEAVFSELS